MIDELIEARVTRRPISRPTLINPKLGIAEAYQLQEELVKKLISEKGERLMGYKLSPKTVPDESQPQTMIPVYGSLFTSMLLKPGVVLKKTDFIDLHIENEVAFILGHDIPPEKVAKAADLARYVTAAQLMM